MYLCPVCQGTCIQCAQCTYLGLVCLHPVYLVYPRPVISVSSVFSVLAFCVFSVFVSSVFSAFVSDVLSVLAFSVFSVLLSSAFSVLELVCSV